MRRDYFRLNTAGVKNDDSGRPVVRVIYEGPTDSFEPRLSRGKTRLDSDDIDIGYRLQDAVDSNGPAGVLAIADRVTGDYLLELNADAGPVFDLIEAVHSDGENDDHYRLVIETTDGEELGAYEKSTLLVYDHEGDLLRDRSLIPSGVEI